MTVQREEDLLRWSAPARPFKKRDREYYTTILAIVFLLVVILLFMKQWMLIAVLIAFAFVSYVLAAVPPENTEHKITSRGIRTGGKLYEWEDLNRYWFSEKWKQMILEVEVKTGFPGRLLMLLGEVDREILKEVLDKNLKFEKPEPVLIDKAAKWLADKVPLESA